MGKIRWPSPLSVSKRFDNVLVMNGSFAPFTSLRDTYISVWTAVPLIGSDTTRDRRLNFVAFSQNSTSRKRNLEPRRPNNCFKQFVWFITLCPRNSNISRQRLGQCSAPQSLRESGGTEAPGRMDTSLIRSRKAPHVQILTGE